MIDKQLLTAHRLHVDARRGVGVDEQGGDDGELAHHPEGQSGGRRILRVQDQQRRAGLHQSPRFDRSVAVVALCCCC